MPLFGKPKKKQSAFDIRLTPTLRDRAAERRAAAADAIIAKVAREKKTQEARDAAVAEAEAIKERARLRREAAEKKDRKEKAARQQREQAQAEERSACTCRKPTLDKRGKCTRCRKIPASPRRRRRGR